MSLNDNLYQSLKLAGYDGHINDMMYAFYADETGNVGAQKNLNELMIEYYGVETATDAWKALRDAGYVVP